MCVISENKDLRNESNIFSVDRGINQKRTENCINVAKVFRSFFFVCVSMCVIWVNKDFNMTTLCICVNWVNKDVIWQHCVYDNIVYVCNLNKLKFLYDNIVY